MIKCNLMHYPEFFVGMRTRMMGYQHFTQSVANSEDFRHFLKQEYDLDVSVYAGSVTWEVWMKEEDFVMFSLRWS